MGPRHLAPKTGHGGTKILDQEDQVQRMCRGAFKAKLGVPRAGALIDRVNE